MKDLRSAVRGHSEALEELPLVHTSRCDLLPKLLQSNALEPQLCPVFDEYLVYLFYGRPAYRSRRGTSPGESVVLCPVCFVFKPGTVAINVTRVFPCDSGALSSEVFSPSLAADDLAQLALDPTIEAIRQYVSLFFSSNGDYFLGQARPAMSADLDESGRRFYELLLTRGPVRFDDRRSAVEVQIRGSIDLKQHLLYVVLPSEFLDDPDVRGAIFRTWNCEPIPYPTFAGDSPASYYGVLRDRLFHRLKDSTRI